jgi:4-hydroxy-tetrahydrodipicolinate synthase
MIKLDGIVPVIPTPFHDDESIDEVSLRRAVEFVAARSMAAICLPAYGSEFYKLSDAEREGVVAVAIDQTRGRIPVIAQVNHPSARVAADLAHRYEQLGADLVGVAIPRQFGATDADRLQYCGRVASAVSCAVLVQDFNPGGPTVGVEFIAAAHNAHPNITYFKLEEPLVADKLAAVRERLADRVGILGGWGGFYMIESLSAGICGIMPGVSISDALSRVYLAHRRGDAKQAYQLFSKLLPYIAFSMQELEVYLQIEKRLLVRRGLLDGARCRQLTRTLSPHVTAHVEFLLDEVETVLRGEGLI